MLLNFPYSFVAIGAPHCICLEVVPVTWNKCCCAWVGGMSGTVNGKKRLVNNRRKALPHDRILSKLHSCDRPPRLILLKITQQIGDITFLRDIYSVVKILWGNIALLEILACDIQDYFINIVDIVHLNLIVVVFL